MRPSLIVHGGAWDIPDEAIDASNACCLRALRAGSAAGLRHVRNPVRVARAILEHSPHMMLISEGAERFAVKHDITLCDSEALVSPAEREAWERCREDSHAAEHHRGHEQGTVGAVALDEQGRLFAATST